MCAAAGFDWVLLDLEHGAGGEEQVRDVVPAAGALRRARPWSGSSPPSGSGSAGCWTLGAAGIMLPRHRHRRRGRPPAIRHLRYPPAGDRGVATYNRACRFGLDPGALDRADDEVLGVVQIEIRGRRGRASTTSPRSTGSTCCSSAPATSATTSASPADLTAPVYLAGPGAVLAAAQAARQGRRAARSPTAPRPPACPRQGWSFLAIGSDSTLLAGAVAAELHVAADLTSAGETP